MRPPPAVAADQLGVFTWWQAQHSGWTPDHAERAVRAGHAQRLRRGVYALPDIDTAGDVHARARRGHARQAVAAALATPGTRVAGCAAAVVHGLPVLHLPARPCVAGEPWLTNSVPAAHLHRCPGHDAIPAGAVSIDPVARAVTDIAREHGVVAGVVSLDAALHAGLVDPAGMAAEIAGARRWPGVRRARQALDLADPRCESPLESRSRVALIRRGLDEPATQVAIGTGWGTFVARVDFYWDEVGVVGEADGAGKYDDPGALRREKQRQEALEQLGLRVVRWGDADLRDSAALEARVRRAFAHGQRPGSPERGWTVLPDRPPPA